MEVLSRYENQEEEIIIKCDINDIVKRFIKESLIIWYNPNVVNSHENSNFLEELKVISDVKAFIDLQEAVEYLENTQIPCCQIITSGTNNEKFVREISHLRHVYSSHIFCDNIEEHKIWITQYPKVISIDTDFSQLKANVEKKLIEVKKKMSSLRTDLPVYAPIFDDTDKSQNMYLHYYLKGFVHFQNRSQAKKDLLNLARALYPSDEYINDFERNYNEYSMKDILRWYTKETFLYKITNNCLRIATPDSIQYCRFVLQDLEQAIKEKYQKGSKDFSGLLYRGAFISNEEWANLVRNKGKEIEIYGFLSTSKQQTVALSFIKGATDKKAMITIIVPAAPDKGEQGFAEIKNYSQFESEDEVLFNVMSKFTILEATQEIIGGIKCRHLVLLYGAQEMRKFALESPLIYIKTKELKACHVCRVETSKLNVPVLLVNPVKFNEYSCLSCLEQYQAEKNNALICIHPSISSKGEDLVVEGFAMEYIDNLKIDFYGSRCDKCKSEKLKYCAKCINCERKKTYCETCFYQNECIQQEHLMILETHPFSFWSEKITQKELNHINYYQQELKSQSSKFFQQPTIFYETHNYRGTIDYYNKFLDEYGIKHDQITANVLNNLGNAHSALGEHQKAIQNYSEALQIQKDVLGEQHSDTASSFHNLGNAYCCLGDYQKAIQNYSEALQIQKGVLGEQHSDTASSYKSLGDAFFHLGEYHKAIKHYYKALEIQKTILGYQHPETASSYNNLGNVYLDLGEYKEAFQFFVEALEKKKTVFGDLHPETASCYINLGNVYCRSGDYQKAIQNYSEALEIQKKVLGDQHSDTASSYNNLGTAYHHLGEYHEAIKYYLKAKKIQKTALGDQNRDLASSYNNLGTAYHCLEKYQKAIQYYSKALEIKKAVLREQHPSIASSYFNLGNAYHCLIDYYSAIEFHSKALEIRKAVLKDQHPSTAASYNNLGIVYSDLGEYQKATECYSKALEIRIKVLGDQHVDTRNTLGLLLQNIIFIIQLESP